MTLCVRAKCNANNEDISGICLKNNIILGLIFSGMFCMKQHTRIYSFTSWKNNYIARIFFKGFVQMACSSTTTDWTSISSFLTRGGWRSEWICQGERTKFDRFVDPNVRGAKRRVYFDLGIYVFEFFLRLKIHRICEGVPRFDIENLDFIVRMTKPWTIY